METRCDWIREIIKTHVPELLQYALFLTDNLDHASKAILQVCVHLGEKGRGAVTGDLKLFLFCSVRKQSMDLAREEIRKSSSMDPEEEPAITSGQGMGPGKLELLEKGNPALQIIRKFPDTHQEWFRLKWKHRFSSREISLITGIPEAILEEQLMVTLHELMREMPSLQSAADAGQWMETGLAQLPVVRMIPWHLRTLESRLTELDHQPSKPKWVIPEFIKLRLFALGALIVTLTLMATCLSAHYRNSSKRKEGATFPARGVQ